MIGWPFVLAASILMVVARRLRNSPHFTFAIVLGLAITLARLTYLPFFASGTVDKRCGQSANRITQAGTKSLVGPLDGIR